MSTWIESSSNTALVDFGFKAVDSVLTWSWMPTYISSRYGSVPRRILIRKCYVELYNIAQSDMIRTFYGFSATVFLGVPGIGKSVFVIYFIYRYISDTRNYLKSFAFEFARNNYLYFGASCTPGIFTMQHLTGLVPDDNLLLLCDVSNTESPVLTCQFT